MSFRALISFHAEASPYVRYKHHPEEITLCVPAGSAVLMPAMMFHGTHPNTDTQPRELIQFGYRPAWAGPIQPMEEWDPENVAAAPDVAKPYLQSLNTTGATRAQAQEHEDRRAGDQSEPLGRLRVLTCPLF